MDTPNQSSRIIEQVLQSKKTPSELGLDLGHLSRDEQEKVVAELRQRKLSVLGTPVACGP